MKETHTHTPTVTVTDKRPSWQVGASHIIPLATGLFCASSPRGTLLMKLNRQSERERERLRVSEAWKLSDLENKNQNENENGQCLKMLPLFLVAPHSSWF